MIVIISAPSGSGKSSIIKELLARNTNFSFSTSVTTRPIRPHEIHGKSYHFISKDDFNKLIANDEMIEHTISFDNMYGTKKTEMMKMLNENKIVICDIDEVGAAKIINFAEKIGIKYLTIWIDVPKEVIISRLLQRDSNSNERVKFIEKNYDNLYNTKANIYMHSVKNDDLFKAVDEIETIIQKFYEN